MSPDALTTLLRSVEDFRRTEQYNRMNEVAHTLFKALEGNTTSKALRIRAKAEYERTMAAFQQAEASLAEALRFAVGSATCAEMAGDPIGMLYADMVRGGHVLPALRRKDEAIALLKSAHERAVQLTPDDEAEKLRLSNLLMNILLHLMDLTIESDGSSGNIQDYVLMLEDNSAFQIYLTTKPEWASGYIEKAKAFIRSKA